MGKSSQSVSASLGQAIVELSGSAIRAGHGAPPWLKARWQSRQQRPPSSIAWGHKHFQQLWVVDGSTLETLFRKLESLQDQPAKLAGKLYAVVDLVTQLPIKVWLEENPYLNGTVVWTQLLGLTSARTLLIFDRGFYDFRQFAALVEQDSAWLSPMLAIASVKHLPAATTSKTRSSGWGMADKTDL